MKRLALVLVSAVSAVALRAADGPETALSDGIALVQQGDFEAAVLKLDEAVRGLSGDATRTRPLADGYLYLGISYLELNQELNARAKFREVLKVEPKRRLSERVFSAQVIRVFEAARQELYPQKKKRNILPLLLIAGGGAASAGVAVAASGGETTTTTTTLPPSTTVPAGGGGGGGGSTTTTTTIIVDPGGPTTTPSSTTPTTTLPGSTPSPTGTPSPTPTGPTATPTPTPTPTPTSPTTTTTLGCTYSMNPPSVNVVLLGGSDVCAVTTNLPSCSWTAQASDAWIQFTGQTSGPGNGAVPWTAGLTLTARTGEITLTETQGATSARCRIVQGGVTPPPDSTTASISLTSLLQVDAATAQLVINDEAVQYQRPGDVAVVTAPRAGRQRIVAQIMSAAGKPGTWTFRLGGTVIPGSVRVEAGRVLTFSDRMIVFSLDGKPGERVVFSLVLASAR